MAMQLRCRACPNIADNPPLPQPCKELLHPCMIEAIDIVKLLSVFTQSVLTNISYSGVQAGLIGAVMRTYCFANQSFLPPRRRAISRTIVGSMLPPDRGGITSWACEILAHHSKCALREGRENQGRNRVTRRGACSKKSRWALRNSLRKRTRSRGRHFRTFMGGGGLEGHRSLF